MIQTLGLSEPNPFPLLGQIMDEGKLHEYVAEGLVSEVRHPDGQTVLYTYTRKCLDEAWWDPITMNCRGMVVRNGRVIARPPRKFFNANTKAFPETIPESWPKTLPEVTEILDGEQVVLYEGFKGPELATRDALSGAVPMWAGWWYRKHLGQATWPAGYTPVFVVLNDKFRKIIDHSFEGLALIAMVNLTDGSELDRAALLSWAKTNDTSVVREFVSLSAWENLVKFIKTPRRGCVLKWERGNEPPLRVGLPEKEYLQLRTIVSRVTPQGIWDLLRQEADIEKLKDRNLPKGFVTWVEGWERQLQNKKWAVEGEAKRVFWAAGGIGVERKKLFERFRAAVLPNRGYLMPLLVALANGQEPGPYGWQAAKVLTLGQRGWRNQAV